MTQAEEYRINVEDWTFYGFWNVNVFFGSVFFKLHESTIYRKLNLEMTGDMFALRNHFYIRQSDLDYLRDLAVKSIETDRAYIRSFVPICEQVVSELLDLVGKKDLFAFVKKAEDVASLSLVIEHTAMAIDQYYHDYCDKHNESFEEFSALIRPIKSTPLIDFFTDLQSKSDEYILEKHSWVGTHGFEGESITKEKIAIERMKKHSTDENLKSIPTVLEPIAEVASILVYLRSYIMENFDKVCFLSKLDFTEFAEKHDLTFDDLMKCTNVEMARFVKTGSGPDDLRERGRYTGLVVKNGSAAVLSEEQTEYILSTLQPPLRKDITEVRGKVGNKGLVKGIVKNLSHPKDVAKVKEGDIIVASETTVDYVIAMGRAAAFVTDQGGITSHAAVIAREMNKPCVIGTKHATRVFNDGDLIEVDANKGVVRKI